MKKVLSILILSTILIGCSPTKPDPIDQTTEFTEVITDETTENIFDSKYNETPSTDFTDDDTNKLKEPAGSKDDYSY